MILELKFFLKKPNKLEVDKTVFLKSNNGLLID